MIDIGNGPPLVMIPGLQGRWEWMRPAVEALATRFRVITFSLAGEKGSGSTLDTRLGFDTYVQQVDRVLDTVGVTAATICGVSFGGLIAYRFATLHPERTRQLVLASPLPTDYALDGRFRLYGRAPRLLFPAFCVDSAWRVAPELRAAVPKWQDRTRLMLTVGSRVLRAPTSPARMRQRIALLAGVDFRSAIADMVPVLLITGEEALDRTVPPELSRKYLHQLQHAEVQTLAHTGHLGSITRPDAFAELVATFVARTRSETPRPAPDRDVM
jgi:3-oxoadipate enol-lactonase